MKPSQSGEKKATRQCWECLKRRLVCDHTLPHCTKCQKAGKECPGYDEQKPLQWIQPGKVTSRRRKKDCPPKIYQTPAKEPITCVVQKPPARQVLEQPPTITTLATFQDTLLDAYGCQDFVSAVPPLEGEWSYIPDHRQLESREDYLQRMNGGLEVVGRIFESGGRAKLEEVVNGALHEEAAYMTGNKNYSLERLEFILRLLENNDLPSYNYLCDETSEVVQAVNYCELDDFDGVPYADYFLDNVRVHPTCKASGELAPNPALILFPLSALHVLPEAIHHTLVCLSVNHFVHSLPAGADKSVAVANRSKVYQHRGAAIRALSQYVAKDKTRCSDMSIASILMFMSMEVRHANMYDVHLLIRSSCKTRLWQTGAPTPTA
jgi:hypothetical protein